jgi:hypothetical protein
MPTFSSLAGESLRWQWSRLCCVVRVAASLPNTSSQKNTPPVQTLSIAFPPSAPLQAMLAALIVYGGPGSWKREALWDEYVVTIPSTI